MNSINKAVAEIVVAYRIRLGDKVSEKDKKLVDNYFSIMEEAIATEINSRLSKQLKMARRKELKRMVEDLPREVGLLGYDQEKLRKWLQLYTDRRVIKL